MSKSAKHKWLLWRTVFSANQSCCILFKLHWLAG